jgi:hypothetical protein
MDIVDLLQWPAMPTTVVVGLQFCLAAINIRGVYKNE